MASGLFALLDDVAAIAKLAAASIDDVGAAAAKAGAKSAGVVIDDTAVTPAYVTGLDPERELPIIWRIAKGSLRNKLLILLPAAMLLSAFLPVAITPLLMIGGAFLCFEGAEKVVSKLQAMRTGHDDDLPDHAPYDDPQAIEDEKVAGAVRTDLILSAEIMAIALGEIALEPLMTQAMVLIAVAIAITAGVYGAVGLIVKMDDIGLHLAKRQNGGSQALGRGLVHAMPILLHWLSVVGTAAMLWVGGGIIVHGMEVFHFDALPHAIHHLAEVSAHALPAMAGFVEWLVTATLSGLFGLAIGWAIVLVHHAVTGHGTKAHDTAH